jgi:hypothetical protein
VPRKRSLYAVANERVSFDTAMAWAGAGSTGARERGMKVTCPSCGEQGALRVYPDHGWCFGEQQYFSPVGLLAEVWDMDREEAAIKALDRIGYVPASYAHLWDEAQRECEPALDDLSAALRTWCEASCPDWRARQYDDAVARALSRCLGLLPAVRTEADCRKWLTVSKTVMGRVLSRASRNSLT